MKKIFLILLSFVTTTVGYAQDSADSALWKKFMFAYVDALKADMQFNKDLLFNKRIAVWKLPLNKIFDKDSIEYVKNDIDVFLSDSLEICTNSQREQAISVVKMLDMYEVEANRMIAAFKITDSQMLDNLKYCNSQTIVHTFSQMYLKDWFENSSLAAFSKSGIPYLSQISIELRQMLDKLCNQKTATPDLLQQFFGMEYRISTNHIKRR